MLQNFFIFDPGSLLSFIAESLQSLNTGLYQVISEVAGESFDGLGAVWNGLESLFSWVKSVFAALAGALQNIAEFILQNVLPAIRDFIEKILAAVKRVLQPIINYFKMQMAWLMQMYNTVIRPIMNFLQRLRGILVLFRLFGLKWAQELDQYIADLENRINQAFLKVYSTIGGIEQTLAGIVGPTGALAPLFAILSALGSIQNLYAYLWGVPNQAPGAQTLAEQQQMAAANTWPNAQQAIQARASGPTPADLSAYTNYVQIFQNDGYGWVH